MSESIHNDNYYKKIFGRKISSDGSTIDLLEMPFDDFQRFLQPFNTGNKALTTSLFGINHRDVKTITQSDKDQQGYVFFTRPQLNLTDDNCRTHRTFMNLLVQDKNNIFRYIRNLLDPRLGTIIHKLYNTGKETYVTGAGPANICEFLDNENPFIIPFTNYITSCTGWPEPILPTYTSQEGVNGEQSSQVDGNMDIYNTYDISCTFRNVKESIILLIAYYWSLYSSLVFNGSMTPYHDFIAANEYDYNTRIWRLILDETKTRVKYIGSTGASFITAPNVASVFNFNEGNPYVDQNREITINFRSIGACYHDPILIKEFNTTVGIFNPDMAIIHREKLTGKISGRTNYRKIPQNLLSLFNFRGYPMIDYETNELEWFMDKNSPTYRRAMDIASSGTI